MTIEMLRSTYPGTNPRWVMWCLDTGLDPHTAQTFQSRDGDFFPWLEKWWDKFFRSRKRPVGEDITPRMQETFDKWLLKQLVKEWNR